MKKHYKEPFVEFKLIQQQNILTASGDDLDVFERDWLDD